MEQKGEKEFLPKPDIRIVIEWKDGKITSGTFYDFSIHDGGFMLAKGKKGTDVINMHETKIINIKEIKEEE